MYSFSIQPFDDFSTNFRFGESVTPAMLSKANANTKGIAPASEPAWKRRRDQSPPKQSGFYTPASSRSSESKIQNPVDPNPKKNLFQADWKSNDIAKAQGEAKRKDMEVLMNRFKTVSQTETEQNRGTAGNSCNPPKSSPNRHNPRSPVRKSPMPRPRSRSPVRKSPAKPVFLKFYMILPEFRYEIISISLNFFYILLFFKGLT